MEVAPPVEFSIKELTPGLQKLGSCSDSDKNWCMMLFEKRSNRSDILSKVQKNLDNSSVKFYWVDIEKYPAFHVAFGRQDLVMLRGKKKKYNVFKGKKTEQDLISFIELALAGGGDSIKMRKIPSIVRETRDDL